MQAVAWFCRSRATECDSTTGTSDKSSKKVREYSHWGEKWSDENLLGAPWMSHVISTFLMMNTRGKDNSEIPPGSYTASLVIIGHVDRMIIMPWWRAYFRPNTILGEWERPLHLWRAHDKVAGDEHTLPWWSCLSNEWPIGLPKGVQKALRPNWTARRNLRVMERFFWWRDEEP